MERVPITEYRQHGADHFARNVRIPRRDFACDDEEIYPGLPESLLWAVGMLLFVLLIALAMGADIFKILRLVVA